MTYRAQPQEGIAWITGASSGIGRAAALELAKRGWTVAATARNEKALTALALEASNRILPYPCDVTDEAAMAQTFATIERDQAPIALAFLNAGISPYVTARSLDLTALHDVIDVNLFGVINGLKPLLETMAKRGRGQVAVCGSVAGYGGLPRAAAYGASKAAVIYLCEALKYDCDALGITLQIVNPGFVDTPLTRKNDFPMPFMISDHEAASRLCDGFAKAGFEITFPRRLAWGLKLLQLLPYPLYFRLVSKATGLG